MRKNLPLVTIGIPVKNRVWCIRRLLEAVDSLEYPKDRIKLVFVDDYSTDGTFEILAEWKARMEKRYYAIVLVRERTNIPQARNLCVKNMEGKYLLFWDADVLPPPDLLKTMVVKMEGDPTVGIIGADYIYESNTRHKPVIDKETHAVYMGFTLIRREVFDKVGGFNEKLSVGEDTEFGIRVKESTHYKIIWSPKPVLHLKRPGDKWTFYRWLKYNFHIRAKEYGETFGSLPRFLKIRILYYILLPWIVIVAIIGITILNLSVLLVLLAYLFASMYLVIRQKGLKDGITTWVKFNLPTGLALSYGIFKIVIKNLLKKSQ